MKRPIHTLIGFGATMAATQAFVIKDSPTAPPRAPEELSAFTAYTPTASNSNNYNRVPYLPDLAQDTLSYAASPGSIRNQGLEKFAQDFVAPVLGASFLVTGNTVGAGCLVMPELASGPGLATTAGIFGAVYLVNLVSGLLLAQVAITQHEQSGGGDVPASFQEFAEAGLESPLAANGIAAVSLFVNGCVQAFDVSRAGVLGASYLGLDASTASILWATAAIGLVGTQSTHTVSKVASLCATGLFLSFAGLLIPGLAGVSDPVGTWLAPGTAAGDTSAVVHAAPVILMAMVYQNIVPTVVKLLDYDRTKVSTALTMGSLLPLFMYLGWSYACLGGGIDGALSGLLLAGFSVSALAGSTLGSTLSLTQEVKNFVPEALQAPQEKAPPQTEDKEGSGLFTAAISVGTPLAAALAFSSGNGFTEALSLAGSFGSPLLYGAIPVAMVWKQLQDQKESGRQPTSPPVVPTPAVPVLGALSLGFVGQEFLQRVSEVVPV